MYGPIEPVASIANATSILGPVAECAAAAQSHVEKTIPRTETNRCMVSPVHPLCRPPSHGNMPQNRDDVRRVFLGRHALRGRPDPRASDLKQASLLAGPGARTWRCSRALIQSSSCHASRSALGLVSVVPAFAALRLPPRSPSRVG